MKQLRLFSFSADDTLLVQLLQKAMNHLSILYKVSDAIVFHAEMRVDWRRRTLVSLR